MGGEFDVISRSLFFSIFGLSSAVLTRQKYNTNQPFYFHTSTLSHKKNVSNTCLYQKKAVILQANDCQKYSCPTPY